MRDGPGRLFGVLCVLAGVWVGTYWLWEPSGPRTTLDESEPVRVEGLDAIPITPPPVLPVRPAGRGAGGAAGNTAARSDVVGEVERPVRMVTRIEPPQYQDYVVQPEDTWARISRKFFGDSSKATLLTRHNPLVSPDLLRPGVTIRIPKDPNNLQGLAVQVPDPAAKEPEGSAKGETGVGAAEPAIVQKPLRTYVIERDDTLWNIAKRFYGKGAMWRVIAEANVDLIPDPHNPPTGVEIVIPEQP